MTTDSSHSNGASNGLRQLQHELTRLGMENASLSRYVNELVRERSDLAVLKKELENAQNNQQAYAAQLKVVEEQFQLAQVKIQELSQGIYDAKVVNQAKEIQANHQAESLRQAQGRIQDLEKKIEIEKERSFVARESYQNEIRLNQELLQKREKEYRESEATNRHLAQILASRDAQIAELTQKNSELLDKMKAGEAGTLSDRKAISQLRVNLTAQIQRMEEELTLRNRELSQKKVQEQENLKLLKDRDSALLRASELQTLREARVLELEKKISTLEAQNKELKICIEKFEANERQARIQSEIQARAKLAELKEQEAKKEPEKPQPKMPPSPSSDEVTEALWRELVVSQQGAREARIEAQRLKAIIESFGEPLNQEPLPLVKGTPTPPPFKGPLKEPQASQ